jgi:hypothetical protein
MITGRANQKITMVIKGLPVYRAIPWRPLNFLLAFHFQVAMLSLRESRKSGEAAER